MTFKRLIQKTTPLLIETGRRNLKERNLKDTIQKAQKN
jgi:hypothetical protein